MENGTYTFDEILVTTEGTALFVNTLNTEHKLVFITPQKAERSESHVNARENPLPPHQGFTSMTKRPALTIGSIFAKLSAICIAGTFYKVAPHVAFITKGP